MPLLDLDAEIHAGLLQDALNLITDRLEPAEVTRVIDVGSGTGSGTFAIARRFPSAEVIALDRERDMVELVQERSVVHGLEGRVRAVLADVTSGALVDGSVDLGWSSSVLHEVEHPERALGAIFDALRPGGLLVVMEMDAPPRLLPAHLGDFEERLRAAAQGAVPEGPDWAPALRSAGFDLDTVQILTLDQHLPADGAALDYARLELRRLGRVTVSGPDGLSGDDTAALFTLLGEGPGDLCDLGELWIRGTRTVWVARRP